MVELVLGGIASLAALITALFVIRKAAGWLLPVRVYPGLLVRFGEGSDEIQATITNRSSEPLYIVKCRGRSANSWAHIIRTHLRHPFIKPRLYTNVWFGATVYNMMGDEPIKLEPNQPIQLSHHLSFKLPFMRFTTPLLLVEVTLSNGRTFRSGRLAVPEHWKLRPRMGGQLENETHA